MDIVQRLLPLLYCIGAEVIIIEGTVVVKVWADDCIIDVDGCACATPNYVYVSISYGKWDTRILAQHRIQTSHVD